MSSWDCTAWLYFSIYGACARIQAISKAPKEYPSWTWWKYSIQSCSAQTVKSSELIGQDIAASAIGALRGLIITALGLTIAWVCQIMEFLCHSYCQWWHLFSRLSSLSASIFSAGSSMTKMPTHENPVNSSTSPCLSGTGCTSSPSSSRSHSSASPSARLSSFLSCKYIYLVKPSKLTNSYFPFVL